MMPVEAFFGVYLLFSKNPQYFGRTYIGYTVDPRRRLSQHNKGAVAGGARRTSKRGPWCMVLIVHGFPNEIAALRFEWAWQHPTISRRLKKLGKKRAKEKSIDYCLRILGEMLHIGPWHRLPLTLRWLDESFHDQFGKPPPWHIPIANGAIVTKKTHFDTFGESNSICVICKLPITAPSFLKCLKQGCSMTSHLICLSQLWLRKENESDSAQWIPIEGECPVCAQLLLWGDLIQQMKGCDQNEAFAIDTNLLDLSDSEEED